MKMIFSITSTSIIVFILWSVVVFFSALVLWGLAIGKEAWTANGPETLAGAILTLGVSVPLLVLGAAALGILAAKGVVSRQTTVMVTGAVAVSILAIFGVCDFLAAKNILNTAHLTTFHKFFLRLAGM